MQMGRVHQRPTLIDRRVVQQPLHRPGTAHGLALTHFRHLFGDMDMDGQILSGQLRQQNRQGFRRHRTQAVQGHADFQQMAFLQFQTGDQCQIGLERMPEPALALMQGAAIETTGLIQHRQQGQADAGIFGSTDDGL